MARPVVFGVSRPGPDRPAVGGDVGRDDLGVVNSGVAGDLSCGTMSTSAGS